LITYNIPNVSNYL